MCVRYGMCTIYVRASLSCELKLSIASCARISDFAVALLDNVYYPLIDLAQRRDSHTHTQGHVTATLSDPF